MAMHQTTVEIAEPVPSEIDAGAEMLLTVKVSCPEACDLCGIPVNLMVADEVVNTQELTRSVGARDASACFVFRAPEQVGGHAWAVMVPKGDDETHEEGRLAITFTTKPHDTSMAVWDVPSPVVISHPFTVKVGVKCSAPCQLAGRVIDVCDGEGHRVATGTLGDSPWPGTTALYVAEYRWSLRRRKEFRCGPRGLRLTALDCPTSRRRRCSASGRRGRRNIASWCRSPTGTRGHQSKRSMSEWVRFAP